MDIGLYGWTRKGDIFRAKGDIGLYGEPIVDMLAWAGKSIFDVHLGLLMSTLIRAW